MTWDRSRWLSWLGKAVLCTCRDISKAAPENKESKPPALNLLELLILCKGKQNMKTLQRDPSSRQRGAGVELQRELRHPQACEGLRVSPHHSHRGNLTLCCRKKPRVAPHGHPCTMRGGLSSAAPALPPEPCLSAAALQGEQEIH